ASLERQRLWRAVHLVGRAGPPGGVERPKEFTDNEPLTEQKAVEYAKERFTRIDKDALQHRLTMDDPTAFTRPSTLELPAVRMDADLYQYAGHEGAYAMRNLLSASCAAERQAAGGVR